MKQPLIARAAMRIIGYTSVAILRMVSLILPARSVRRDAPVPQTIELDRTGILVNSAEPLEVAWRDGEVIFPLYATSLAHSFWRAQEFSLFMQNMATLRAPILDFGCGDGSFAAVLFSRIDYGSDIDEEALKIARNFDIYANLLHSEDTRISLPDATVNSAISNSVLEHVRDLDAVIRELSRVLAPNGVLMFSVPVRQFARDLQLYFGKLESEQVNADFYHRNLLEVADWESLLKRNGLSIVSIRHFQPDWFSFYYWMLRFLGRRGLGRFVPSIRERVWRFRGKRLVEMVRRSISETAEGGGNIFVIARKLA
jgi:SAM-dependent methyltransferase